ncbi:glutathione S-transferase N-terminal domain-containing protein [Candidatus Parcubacteria bacterium]|nr:glutathione S-transferase N-terminal domain-containing protein [Candidatus Parcubacteria bacterium]
MDKKNVKLYTTDNCSFCFTLREFLKESNVEFEEISISHDEKKRDELLKRLDEKGIWGSVPILDISGELIIGFEREKICNLLNIKE